MDIKWNNVTRGKVEFYTPVIIIHLNNRGFCSKSEELIISLIIKLTHTIHTEYHMLKQDVIYQSTELPLGI
jgi:hypothetical protein